MSDAEKIEQVIEREEFMVRELRSDVGRMTVAAALRRAGIRDEASIVANALLTREDSVPLPMTVADGVIAYLTNAIEAGTEVRRAALKNAIEEERRKGWDLPLDRMHEEAVEDGVEGEP